MKPKLNVEEETKFDLEFQAEQLRNDFNQYLSGVLESDQTAEEMAEALGVEISDGPNLELLKQEFEK